MIVGLDSSAPPNASQAAQAKAAGIQIWSGYLQTHSDVGLYRPWSQADFDVARQCGAMPLAYCSGNDDPTACKKLAAEWNVRLCLDVESGIRGDGPWVQSWLDASGAGLYGNAPVHNGRRAAFHVLAAYPGVPETATWPSDLPRPSGPCAWQWQGTHTEFGAGVDRTNFDNWFAQGRKPMILIVNTPSNGVWMLSGSMYVHVDDPPVLSSLQASGACAPNAWTVDANMHEALLAASDSAQRPSAAPGPVNLSGTVTGTLNPA